MTSLYRNALVAIALAVSAPAAARAESNSERTPDVPLAAPEPQSIRYVRSPTVKVNFELWAGRGSLTSIDLWITEDRSVSWKHAEIGATTGPPVVWTASRDGLYGLYLIASNSAGASSPPPTPGTAPQQWVVIDSKPPRITKISATRDRNFELNRRIDIRWAADDDNLIDRPISIYFRPSDDALFIPIAKSLPNDGAYAWTVPNELDGRIVIKIEAADRCGQTGEAVMSSIEMPASARPAATLAPAPNARPPHRAAANSAALSDFLDPPAAAVAPPAAPEPDPHAESGNAIARADAKRKRGDWHRARGEWDLAVERYRESIQLDPASVLARRGLAAALIREKKYEEADAAYAWLLSTDPDDVDALRGRAMVQVAQRRYASAAQTMQRLLHLRPEDAEIWLASGDVAMLTGDRPVARQAWLKVQSIPDVPDELVERSKRRLVIYPADPGP